MIPLHARWLPALRPQVAVDTSASSVPGPPAVAGECPAPRLAHDEAPEWCRHQQWSISGEQSLPAWYVHAPPPEHVESPVQYRSQCWRLPHQGSGFAASRPARAPVPAVAFAQLRDYSPARPAACKYRRSCYAPAPPVARFPAPARRVLRRYPAPASRWRGRYPPAPPDLAAPLPRPGAARCDLANLMDDHQGESHLPLAGNSPSINWRGYFYHCRYARPAPQSYAKAQRD